jgi:membrane protein DedA with SNARE-associated domain
VNHSSGWGEVEPATYHSPQKGATEEIATRRCSTARVSVGYASTMPTASIIDSVVTWATTLIGDWGLAAVFVLMLLESACIPVPSEAIMPFAGFAVSEGKLGMTGIIVAGVAGNLVGSWITYAIGYYGGRPFVEHWGRYVLLRPHHLETAQRWFDRYGAPVVFFGRIIPIVRTFISLPAGFGRMPFWKFTLFTVLGCIPWVIMLAYVGKALGANWEKIRPYLHYADYAVIVVLVLLAIWVVLRWRKRRSEGGPDPAEYGDEA